MSAILGARAQAVCGLAWPIKLGESATPLYVKMSAQIKQIAQSLVKIAETAKEKKAAANAYQKNV